MERIVLSIKLKKGICLAWTTGIILAELKNASWLIKQIDKEEEEFNIPKGRIKYQLQVKIAYRGIILDGILEIKNWRCTVKINPNKKMQQGEMQEVKSSLEQGLESLPESHKR